MAQRKPITVLHAVAVLDGSGSMGHCWYEAKAAYAQVITDLKGAADYVTFTGIVFDTRPYLRQPTVEASLANPDAGYIPGDCTALYDAMDTGLQQLAAATVPEYLRAKKRKIAVSNLVVVITDGQDNRSSQSVGTMRLKLEKLQAAGNYTIALNVPPGGRGIGRQLGVPDGNVREWEQTQRGMVETMVVTSSANANYGAQLRRAGASGMSVNSQAYYSSVTTDMANVQAKAVHTALDDISNKFKTLTVDRELSVKQFVEAKTKVPYVVGSAYYLLMKPEKVQPQKAVLIQEKGKAAVWGGDQARNIIGLPQGKHAKVTPGNHSIYDIYVQSASVNRILPRGTKVLVDVTMTQPVKPTWDHTAVKSK